jgi:mRNA interferase RelE/StbE
VKYALRMLPRAEKELGALDSVQYQKVKNKISELRDNPRPPGCRKLSDYAAWRIRVGNYRVIYEIDYQGQIVTIVNVGHRKEMYR